MDRILNGWKRPHRTNESLKNLAFTVLIKLCLYSLIYWIGSKTPQLREWNICSSQTGATLSYLGLFCTSNPFCIKFSIHLIGIVFLRCSQREENRTAIYSINTSKTISLLWTGKALLSCLYIARKRIISIQPLTKLSIDIFLVILLYLKNAFGWPRITSLLSIARSHFRVKLCQEEGGLYQFDYTK